jgi:hypothetical protein
MKTIKKFTVITCLLSIVVVSAAFVNFQHTKEMKNLGVIGGDKGFAVVELFTSEGCSSCPSADKLVARIQKENPHKQIYILAYHVDYWDHQGWKDTFSDADYSKRQKRYASWLNIQSIYTPQIVMNGKTEFVGSDQGALLGAISAGLQETPAESLTIKSSVANGQINVDYQTNGSLKKSDLVIALIQKSGQSKVRAGENSGLTLPHVQIVRKLMIEPLHINSGKLSLALPEDYRSNELELIGFVQKNTNGEILSAAKSELAINTGP